MSRAAAARIPARSPVRNKPPKSGPGSTDKTEADPSASRPDSYWTRSESPLANLAFLCPLLVVYEIGTRYSGQGSIIAFSLLHQFFALLGVGDTYFPPLVVVVTLVAAQLAQKRRPRFLFSDLLGMVVESVVLAVPLLVLWFAAAPQLARLGLFANPAIFKTLPCLGAGIYEEFMFRLIVINLLNFALNDVLQLHKMAAFTLMVVSSAFLFSVYHYLGSEHYSNVTFIFRFLAGLYFAAIFLCRGYAITAGSHASYDIIVVILQSAR